MSKAQFLCLAFLLFFHSGYSQMDSLSLVPDKASWKSGNSVSQQLLVSNTNPAKKAPVYDLKPAVDIPVIAFGTLFTLYATTKIYTKGASTEEEILNLKTSDIIPFDQWSVHPYSQSMDEFSYIPFDASFAFPLVMFLVKKDTRQDFWKLSFLYWEALSVTGIFGAGAPYFIDRYRPYAYTSETSMEQRQVQNAKNSAFSGHVEVIATSTFFIAKVYGDYYPGSKWVMYGFASVATAGMAYLRIKGGMHFPSDVLIGAAIGSLSGILVPHFHKHKLLKNPNMSIMPFYKEGSKGFSFTLNLR